MSHPESLIRPPLQRRSQESLERVLQAGFELLQERGFEGFTLQEVSQRANVSIGSIYARVPSREALIQAVYERAMLWTEEQAGTLEQAAHRPGTTRGQIEAIVVEMGSQVIAHGDVLRVFMRQAPLEPWIMERAAVKSQATAKVFSGAILEHRDEIRHSDPELAVDVAWRMVYNTTARRITHGPSFESTRPLAEDQLVTELARAVADYLL
jgi:AcrR family transcriptional regulator